MSIKISYKKGIRENNIKVALNTGYPSKFQNKIINYFEMNNFIDEWISSEKIKYAKYNSY